MPWLKSVIFISTLGSDREKQRRNRTERKKEKWKNRLRRHIMNALCLMRINVVFLYSVFICSSVFNSIHRLRLCQSRWLRFNSTIFWSNVYIFSFRKSLKMPYLNIGRGLVVSIAHFNCLPSSFQCCRSCGYALCACMGTSGTHDGRWRRRREEAHQWTIIATFSRRQESHIWLRRHWFLYFVFDELTQHTESLPALRTSTTKTYTRRNMWETKNKTHSHTHMSAMMTISRENAGTCGLMQSCVKRNTQTHSLVDLVLMHLCTNETKTTTGTRV